MSLTVNHFRLSLYVHEAHFAVLRLTPSIKKWEIRFYTYELLHPSTGHGILRVNHLGILKLTSSASNTYWCSSNSEPF